MKKSIFLAVAFAFFACAVKATDLIVQEFAPPPSYSSISAAIAAANDGDRIIIINRAGNVPWVENDTVTKSLTFLPYKDDSFFIVQGTWYIAPVTQKIINIIGMQNNTSGIIATTTPSGSRTIVRILSSQLSVSSITMNLNNYDLLVSGCSIYSSVTYRHGNIIGNIVGGITVYSETSATTDTTFIIGNKISLTNNTYGINFSSSTMNCDIRNNFVTMYNSTSVTSYGIFLSSSLTDGALNKVYNNTVNYTVYCNSGYPAYAIYVAMSNVDVMNNVVNETNACSYANYGIYSANATCTATYNQIGSQFNSATGGSFTLNQLNPGSPITINANGSTTTGVNGGNPNNLFYDLDLTPNDAGCYGGSFSLNNYYPLFTSTTQTFVTPSFPFYIRTGNTISVKGTSYDR